MAQDKDKKSKFKFKKFSLDYQLPYNDVGFERRPLLSSSMLREIRLIEELANKGNLTYDMVEEILDQNPDLEDMESRLLDYVYTNFSEKLYHMTNTLELAARTFTNPDLSIRVKDELLNTLMDDFDFKRDLDDLLGKDSSEYLEGIDVSEYDRELLRRANEYAHDYAEAINDFLPTRGEGKIKEFEVVPEGYEEVNIEKDIEEQYKNMTGEEEIEIEEEPEDTSLVESSWLDEVY